MPRVKFLIRDGRRYKTPEMVQAQAERRADEMGLTLDEYSAYCASLIVPIHRNPKGRANCPWCGKPWPCENKLTWDAAIERGRELAAERGWSSKTFPFLASADGDSLSRPQNPAPVGEQETNQ